MISWGSKVGTLPPCWNLLAWVGLGTPCEQALSFLPISHHHGPILLLKRCKISGWNCLSVEGDWCPDDFRPNPTDHPLTARIHPSSINGCVQTPQSTRMEVIHLLPHTGCRRSIACGSFGVLISDPLHPPSSTSWCPRGSARPILAPVGSCRDSVFKLFPSLQQLNLAAAARSNSWSYNLRTGCTMNYLPESAGFLHSRFMLESILL